MPRYIRLPEDEPEKDYEVLSAAFKGDESNALGPDEIAVSASTSDAGAEALSKAKREDTMRKLGKGGAG